MPIYGNIFQMMVMEIGNFVLFYRLDNQTIFINFTLLKQPTRHLISKELKKSHKVSNLVTLKRNTVSNIAFYSNINIVEATKAYLILDQAYLYMTYFYTLTLSLCNNIFPNLCIWCYKFHLLYIGFQQTLILYFVHYLNTHWLSFIINIIITFIQLFLQNLSIYLLWFFYIVGV